MEKYTPPAIELQPVITGDDKIDREVGRLLIERDQRVEACHQARELSDPNYVRADNEPVYSMSDLGTWF